MNVPASVWSQIQSSADSVLHCLSAASPTTEQTVKQWKAVCDSNNISFIAIVQAVLYMLETTTTSSTTGSKNDNKRLCTLLQLHSGQTNGLTSARRREITKELNGTAAAAAPSSRVTLPRTAAAYIRYVQEQTKEAVGIVAKEKGNVESRARTTSTTTTTAVPITLSHPTPLPKDNGDGNGDESTQRLIMASLSTTSAFDGSARRVLCEGVRQFMERRLTTACRASLRREPHKALVLDELMMSASRAGDDDDDEVPHEQRFPRKRQRDDNLCLSRLDLSEEAVAFNKGVNRWRERARAQLLFYMSHPFRRPESIEKTPLCNSMLSSNVQEVEKEVVAKYKQSTDSHSASTKTTAIARTRCCFVNVARSSIEITKHDFQTDHFYQC